MYKTKDYLHNGVLYLNNIIRPHHKQLSTLMIYSTTKCQSRCKHCSIWQKPEDHLSFESIKDIMASRCITKTRWLVWKVESFYCIPMRMPSWSGLETTTPTIHFYPIALRLKNSLKRFDAIIRSIYTFRLMATRKHTSS